MALYQTHPWLTRGLEGPSEQATTQPQGETLDGEACVHYRQGMALLSATAKFRDRLGMWPWRAGICLLLGAFFLYNPFFTISMPSGSSAVVHHPPSYRSTVASSELGCGTVPHTKLDVVPVQAVITPEKVLLQQEDDIRPKPADETVRAVTQDFASSLWFRPPPVL
ncbi:MAG: hypothetical protein ABSH13_04845 [Candidatus Acidiferrum sp.]